MLIHAAWVIGSLYAALLIVLWVAQRQLLYHPGRAIELPAAYGLTEFEEVFIPSQDGVKLQCWHHPPRSGYPLVVYFHGNAGHLGDRAATYDALQEAGFGVLALSYRGYGKSAGEPSEQGLYADARAVLRFARDTLLHPEARTLLFGESLGTGVAVQMATETAVGGLALQAPYTSVADRAAELYFYVPVRLLLKDVFDSAAKVASVRAPLLVLHGERDEVIPAAHGKRLLEAATGPKRGVFFPAISHNDFDSAAISSHLEAFAREHGLIH